MGFTRVDPPWRHLHCTAPRRSLWLFQLTFRGAVKRPRVPRGKKATVGDVSRDVTSDVTWFMNTCGIMTWKTCVERWFMMNMINISHCHEDFHGVHWNSSIAPPRPRGNRTADFFSPPGPARRVGREGQVVYGLVHLKIMVMIYETCSLSIKVMIYD